MTDTNALARIYAPYGDLGMAKDLHITKKIDDGHTVLAVLKDEVARFVSERDWWQFHSPKNLAMSIAIESAELMENFQWLTPAESLRIIQQKRVRKNVEEEIADILTYCMSLANVMGLDMARAVMRKLAKNRRKYPKGKYRGRF